MWKKIFLQTIKIRWMPVLSIFHFLSNKLTGSLFLKVEGHSKWIPWKIEICRNHLSLFHIRIQAKKGVQIIERKIFWAINPLKL